jgi:hypothetical protein
MLTPRAMRNRNLLRGVDSEIQAEDQNARYFNFNWFPLCIERRALVRNYVIMAIWHMCDSDLWEMLVFK